MTVDREDAVESTHIPETASPEKDDDVEHNQVLSALTVQDGEEPPNLAGLSPNKPSIDLESGEALFEQGESLLSGGGSKAVIHRDYAFALLFYVCAAMCAVCFLIFYVFLGFWSRKPSSQWVLSKEVGGGLVLSASIAFGISVLWLVIMNVAAKFMIKISIVFAMGALLISSIVGFVQGWLSVGLISLFLAVTQLAWLSRIWRRAELAATTIGVTVSFTTKYPAVYAVAAASLVAQFIWLWIWTKTSVSTVYYFGATQTSGKILAIYFICLLFWGVQILKNIVHVTTCGSFASWYFRYPNNPEASPTVNALNKACTTSFGSVALGSLLVAIVRTLRVVMNLFCKNWSSMPSCLAVPCRYCFVCIEKLTAYFNVYAFVNVAVYQRSYFDAAKHTCAIVKEAGVDALINDEFVDVALTMGALCGGLVCGIVPALIGPASHSADRFAVMVLGSLLGYTIIMGVLTVVWSSVVTLFVCFAEDALALYRTKPDVFHELVNAWQQRLDVRLTLDESVMSASDGSILKPGPSHTIEDCEAPSLEQHTSLLGHSETPGRAHS